MDCLISKDTTSGVLIGIVCDIIDCLDDLWQHQVEGVAG